MNPKDFPTPEAFSAAHDEQARQDKAPCEHCKTVATPPCPVCAAEERIWKRRRAKKGEPRNFLPYDELLTQWRARKRECADLKKVWTPIEKEMADLKYSRDTMRLLMDQALKAMEARGTNVELALANERLKARLANLTERPDEPRVFTFRMPGGPTPQRGLTMEVWRRLVQLVHPDKHPGSGAAEAATKWLMDNRPV